MYANSTPSHCIDDRQHDWWPPTLLANVFREIQFFKSQICFLINNTKNLPQLVAKTACKLFRGISKKIKELFKKGHFNKTTVYRPFTASCELMEVMN